MLDTWKDWRQAYRKRAAGLVPAVWKRSDDATSLQSPCARLVAVRALARRPGVDAVRHAAARTAVGAARTAWACRDHARRQNVHHPHAPGRQCPGPDRRAPASARV